MDFWRALRGGAARYAGSHSHKTPRVACASFRPYLHYADSSDSPAWTAIVDGQGQEVSWERTIEGIDGDLQVTNLHGEAGRREANTKASWLAAMAASTFQLW